MTYPPEQHLLRDLHVLNWLEDADHGVAEFDITDAIRDSSGRVSLGALVTLADIACTRVALSAVAPDFVATLDLSVTTGTRPVEGRVRTDARLFRAASKIVSIDGHVDAVGPITGSFVRIPNEASLVGQVPAIGVRSQLDHVGPLLTGSITERMGMRVTADTAELDQSDYVGNSFGTINGGALGFLVAAAAEAVIGETAADVTIRYLGQTKVGPARATASIVRRSAGNAIADVIVRDVGAGGACLARALVGATT
jgi:acyl-coenzyme A thioesterase PaaI-like protein